MKVRLLSLTFGALVATLVGANGAHAWFSICNQTNTTVWTTYAYEARRVLGNTGCPSSQPTRYVGWYRIAAKSCRTILNAKAKRYRHWVYGEGSDGSTWGGGTYFDVPQIAYDRCCKRGSDGFCRPSVTTRPSRRLGHGGITPGGSDHTLNLW